MSEPNKLFAYGSFAEGMVHFNKISEFILECQPARVRGSMYQLQVGFPVYLSQGELLIQGQLITLRASATFWAMLDELHGYNPQNLSKSLFHRSGVEVQASGEVISAVIYALNPNKLPKSARFIADGDWAKAMKEGKALTDVLTERQKYYIRRLGTSSGRDIIPIDLAMYRELMNSELIVDKGRRLALTALGQEVLRYLT